MPSSDDSKARNDVARMTPANTNRYALVIGMVRRLPRFARVLEAVVEDDPIPPFHRPEDMVSSARDQWLQIAAYALGQAVKEQAAIDALFKVPEQNYDSVQDHEFREPKFRDSPIHREPYS